MIASITFSSNTNKYRKFCNIWLRFLFNIQSMSHTHDKHQSSIWTTWSHLEFSFRTAIKNYFFFFFSLLCLYYKAWSKRALQYWHTHCFDTSTCELNNDCHIDIITFCWRIYSTDSIALELWFFEHWIYCLNNLFKWRKKESLILHCVALKSKFNLYSFGVLIITFDECNIHSVCTMQSNSNKF